MASEMVDEFGRRLIQMVRDQTIEDWRMIVDGKMKGERAERLRSMIGDGDASRINELVPEIVDSALHHLLVWLEEDTNFHISAVIGDKKVSDLADESDGFAGELYTDRGWVVRFSKKSE